MKDWLLQPTGNESRDEPDLTIRLAVLFEVLCVGIGGYLLSGLIISICGIDSQQMLEDSTSLFLLMVTEATLTLLMVMGFLNLHGESWRGLGLRFDNLLTEVKIGVLAVPVLFLSTIFVSILFRAFLPEYVTEKNPLLEMIQKPKDLGLFSISSLYVGGFKEEIQRALILLRFEQFLGGSVIGLLLWSLFFAYGHSVQGVDNAVGAGVLGLLFGLLYLWRRNLVAPILAHALYDIITLLAYWIVVRGQ